MPRNGSGVYTLPAGNPVITGTVISSTTQNNTMSDVAAELTNSIAADGQKVPTANLPMGGFRHTGVLNANARDQYAAVGQVQDSAFMWCGTAAGTANALTFSPMPAITAYAAGQVFRFQAGAAANTSATTIAVSGLAAIDLEVNGAACVGGEILANKWYEILLTSATNAQLIGSYIHTTGNETKSGILTLTNSPVVPTPTEANQAANKSYVDSASALRGHISGLMLSTAGSSATMSISAGQATDSGGVALMKLLSAISKTTSAWAVGSGNGGLDAGTIANNTWYHFYEIMRADTGVVDVNFSLSGSAPTLPANYTNFRRIGSGKTNGSGQWNRFTQNGDVFEWADPVQDVSVVNQGATSVTYALSVPPAVVTRANILAYAQTSGGSSNVYIRPLTATDAVASTATNVNLRDPTTGNGVTGELTITTNTSSQIAVRASGAVSDFKINTKGWIDRRGRDA
ncbi:hypothetical protein [Herminiimonas contaminans]|uniref:Tail-collar fiber protein n=1 Tax=Herminiimonas contaminans TaxID=1111140 RepID=A0ABS0ES38_9BURK|nr:hypothetical protein [Herminiimonas contaminans]MBF8177652.1 hypothetical protein [Herminiimonas contaminans]